jgi:hypothetical protein
MYWKENIRLNLFLLIIISTILYSCEKKIDWNVEGSTDVKLIVEGSITNEKKNHVVRLSLPVKSLNETPKPASGAKVTITSNTITYVLHENQANSGIYYTDSAFRGAIRLYYLLRIQYEGNNYTATTAMVPTSPLEPLVFEPAKDSAGFFNFQYVESRDASMLELSVDWRDLSQYANIDKSKRQAKMVYYTMESIDVSQIFKPNQQKIYFPAGTKIKRTKYSLNDDEQKFYRSLLFETDWRGGNFDVIPSNVYTNLSDGAVGYFGAYTVVSDSTEVK